MRSGPLQRGGFRLLFAGRAVSALGDRLVPVALAFAVLDLTGSVTDLGIVMGAQTAALAVFVLVGGVSSDRLPRRAVMLVSDVVRAASQGASAALLLSGAAHVWQLALLQAVYGAAEGFFSPASIGIVPQVVEPAQLQPANALLGLTDNGASVLGPALAGVLVATAGAGWGLAADAVTFLLSAALLAMIRRGAIGAAEPSTRRGMLAELREGWQAFRTRTWLWATVLFFTAYICIVYAPYLVLGPEIARTSLGGAGAWATISAAAGVGAVGGGVLGLRWRPRHPLRAGLLTFVLAGPALLLLLGLRAPLWTIVLAALLDGVAGSLFNALWFTAQQATVPAHELSRVSSWDTLGTVVMQPVGLAAAGPVAGALGISTTLYGAAAAIVLLTAAILAVPSVRDFRLARPPSAPANRVVA
jgi:MFS family permease